MNPTKLIEFVDESQSFVEGVSEASIETLYALHTHVPQLGRSIWEARRIVGTSILQARIPAHPKHLYPWNTA